MARYTLVFPPDETKQYYVAWYNHYYYSGSYYIQSNVLDEPIRSVNNFYDDYYSNIINSSAFKQGDPVQNYEYPVDVDVNSTCWCVISYKDRENTLHIKFFVIQYSEWKDKDINELSGDYATAQSNLVRDANGYIKVFLGLINNNINWLYSPGKILSGVTLDKDSAVIRANYSPDAPGVPQENVIRGYVVTSFPSLIVNNSGYVNDPPYRMLSNIDPDNPSIEYMEWITVHFNRMAGIYVTQQGETGTYNSEGIAGFTLRLKFTDTLKNKTADWLPIIGKTNTNYYSNVTVEQFNSRPDYYVGSLEGRLFINPVTNELVYISTNWRTHEIFKYKLPDTFSMYDFHIYTVMKKNVSNPGTIYVYLDNELVITAPDNYSITTFMGRLMEHFSFPEECNFMPFILDYYYAFTKGTEEFDLSKAIIWEEPKDPEFFKEKRDKKIRERIKLDIDRYYAMRLEAHLFHYGIDVDKITKIVYIPFIDPREIIKFAKETRNKQCGFFCEIGKDNLRFEEEMGNLEWVVKALKLDPRIEYTVDSLTEYLEEFDNDPKYPVKNGVYLIVDEDKTIFDSLIEVFKPSNKHVGLFIMLELKPGDHI